MKTILLTVGLFFVEKSVVAQQTIKKTLFYFQDTSVIYPCGNITEVTVFYFVDDTSQFKRLKSEYFIAALCAEAYGQNFFEKNRKYSLVADRNYKRIQDYMPRDIFDEFYKTRKLYVLKKINRLN